MSLEQAQIAVVAVRLDAADLGEMEPSARRRDWALNNTPPSLCRTNDTCELALSAALV
jgi:hypothetical protein